MLLDSGVFHNFIAAPQVIKFSNSFKKYFLYPDRPMEVHLTDNYSVVSHQIVYLTLKFTDSAVHPVEFWAFPLLNHAIILGMPF